MNAEYTGLLIIDMQNDFVQPESPYRIAGAKTTIPAIVDVLEMFRRENAPVFHVTREYLEDGSNIEKFRYKKFMEGKKYAVPNTQGCEIIEELKPIKNEYRIIKNRFSGFMNTELDLVLRRLQIINIVITGTQYPNCIRATAFDAMALGYDVTVVTNATSAATEEIANANITDFKNIGINCLNSSQLEI